VSAALVLLALALLLVPGERAVQARTRALLVPTAEVGPDRFGAAAPLVVSGLLGAAVALGVGGVAGAVAGVVLAVGVRAVLVRLGGDRTAPLDPLAVAGTFDLLAACLRSGLPVATAAEVVAVSAPPALASVLRQAADLLTLGAEPEAAWAAAAAEPAAEPLARLARRSARSGASLAAGVTELAAEQRGRAEDAAAAAAERAGVLVTGPLGLCFLPAFLCLGVVPVVLGLAGPVLQGGIVG
jgi:pilus assembly protein TadC